MFVGHGVNDTKLRIHHAHATQKLLQELGVNLTYREYPVDHGIEAPKISDVNAWLETRLTVQLERSGGEARTAGAT